MTLEDEVKKLSEILGNIPAIGMQAFGKSGAPLFVLDLIIAGAVKRTLSLGYGLLSLVESKNMTCSRALLRMQIDTVSRLLAYTYVKNPEEMAEAVIGGTPLKKFKSDEGKPLYDAYLIDRMSKTHEWVRTVYNSTSGEVHFSEQQLFSSIASMEDDENGRTINFEISQFDTKYPEASWSEIVACFSELCEIFVNMLIQYGEHKATDEPPRSTSQSDAAEL